jgi:hypothetical protein
LTLTIYVREAVALARVAEHQPPTEFVVGFYGSGRTQVKVGGGLEQPLPWLALEYVDGGPAGASLTERVNRTGDGVDPVRALKLARGIIKGVSVLHEEKIVHRDLKPDNVLIAGPVDDEVPKIADCGIARVEGIIGSIAGMTAAYGAPEQVASMLLQGQSNPLVGPWTDVHALAAVLWFVIGGEQWCTGDVDKDWQEGRRRSLRTASRLHPAFVMDLNLLRQLDDVLAQGAAHRLVASAWQIQGAERFATVSQAQFPSMLKGTERFADVDTFAARLLPVLEQFEALWRARAAKENAAATAFRPTQMLMGNNLNILTLAKVWEDAPPPIEGTNSTFTSIAAIVPGNLVFQPDGKLLARFGERLVYFVDGKPHKVTVPEELRGAIGSSRWVARGPGGGYALIGAKHVILIRGGRMFPMPLPRRPDGGAVGEIQAVIGSSHLFGVVTAETDDSNGGPEFWRSSDGKSWTGPTLLPLGGDVHALAEGPYGMLVVGSRRASKARAIFLGLDEQITMFAAGVNDKAPLVTAVAGGERECWASCSGMVLRFDKGAASTENFDAPGAPTAMGLDLVGVPWLVTERAVLRRHVESSTAVWKAYYKRTEGLAPLVGIGFTPDGASVIDARGGLVHIEPHDIASWRKVSGF